MNEQDVLTFWFQESAEKQWFTKDSGYDEQIRQKFGSCHQQAIRGECVGWRKNIRGRLAEIIVLDQFSRNLFRDSPLAFANDGMALVLTQEAIATGEIDQLSQVERSFLFMPLMHSESLVIHDEALKRFAEPGMETTLDFEKRHRDILLRFGRYPHRNQILGRASTDEELAFLTEPGSSF
ncbi:DUF924 domain-containing protein [Vagococcus sp. BWB3-3]|uniref:DUF924 domain-containing protein n=1 Tax=Vagococcus allomyrinae TaxID=2794353 RepID=A0A940P2E1_9ENTE|nr:DUF924 family protein [Vagococcus allomyrinae]MBP1039785.1 DUF924 domain-containing protein [Vagococcus allomyrinae]